jgi:hypothetical protein
MEKHCNIEIAAKVVQVSSNQNGTEFSYGIFSSSVTGNLFSVSNLQLYVLSFLLEMSYFSNIE